MRTTSILRQSKRPPTSNGECDTITAEPSTFDSLRLAGRACDCILTYQLSHRHALNLSINTGTAHIRCAKMTVGTMRTSSTASHTHTSANIVSLVEAQRICAERYAGHVENLARCTPETIITFYPFSRTRRTLHTNIFGCRAPSWRCQLSATAAIFTNESFHNRIFSSKQTAHVSRAHLILSH